MNDILTKITEIIERYESGEWLEADKLRVLLRELTSNIYYLTKYNIEYYEKHNAIQYKHKGSVSAGLILANEQFPELRMLRKIIESANNVARSITMEISILKNETR
jgi:hypothetical protein